MSFKIKSYAFVLVILLKTPINSFGQEKIFEREYTYNASELDSKTSCRVVASNQLRIELLNEIGVYIQSESILKTTEINQNYSQDFIENIVTISAGVTKFKVLDEKWDGEKFWMKAAITIDEKEIKNSLEQIILDKQKLNELENLRRQLKEATEGLEDLRNNQIAQNAAADKIKYESKIKTLEAGDHFLSASELTKFDDFDGAIVEFTKAIELQPNNVDAYHNRGIVRANKKDLNGAIDDFSRTIQLKANHDLAYYNRGNAKDDIKEYESAISDYNKAIKLNPNNSSYYNNRGIAKGHLGDFVGAIKDYSMSIEIDPTDASIYYNRGLAKLNLGQKDSGCKDLNIAGERGYELAYKSKTKRCD